MSPRPDLSLRISHDVALNRTLFARGLPGDEWVGDHHTFWIAWAGDEPAGFCSAFVIARDRTAFFSSAVVFRAYRGRGMQRAMVQRRLAWSGRHGATTAVTYVQRDNYPSLVNLLRCGFALFEPAVWWAGRTALYLQRTV